MNEEVLILGLGGLGVAAAMGLATAGVRRLGLVDGDQVSLSNLHRQVLYQMSDLGRSKADVAGNRLQERFPFLEITVTYGRLETAAEIAAQARHYSVLLDCSDNFATRFAANDAALQLGMPLVHGAATGYLGQVMVIAGPPCLRCLFQGPPPAAEEEGACLREGVVGPLAGEVGWLMALETVKILRQAGEPLTGRLLTIDLANRQRRLVPFRPAPDCGCVLTQPAPPRQLTGRST